MGETSTTPLTLHEKLDWLRLIRSENVGPITFFRLLERFGSAAAALDALPGLTRRGGREGRITVCPRDQAEREMERASEIGAHLIARGEPDYPPLLAQIEDAPPLIHVLGHPQLLKKRAVAVVGARNASANGRRFAEGIAGDLGNNGFLVVSGMARGIDAAAHQGALETGTIGVLGGGVDVIYPKENADLYAALKERGALVSEVEPGTTPRARHFPRRNRLISGLSRGVVVIEAGKRSGSLITARMAGEQGREVFAVPGSPLDPRSGGANDLIRQGAQLTESVADIVDALNSGLRTPPTHKETFENKEPSPLQPGESETAGARRVLENSLDSVPIEVDELLATCQYPPSVVFTALLELELAGRLERHPGNKVSLVRSL